MERGGSNGSHKKKQNPPTSDFECPPPSPMREQDQYMPIANVIRIMRRTLPSHAKISDDTKETIQECVSEFISFVTGEANERCQREQRKTITAEDVLWAMAKLGFDNYVEPLTVYLSRHREVESHHTPYLNSTGGRPSLGPAYDQQRYHQHHHSMESHRAPGGLDAGAAMGGFYRDPTGEGGSSTSHTALPSFDPYAPYK